MGGFINGPSGGIPGTPSSRSLTPRLSPGLQATPGDIVETSSVTETQTPTPTANNSDTSSTLSSHDASTLSSRDASTLSSRDASPVQVTPDNSDKPGESPPPPSSARPPASRAQTWVPTHTPMWSLGPGHGDYLRCAAGYLIGVPGGPKWEDLLARFITLEGLSSSRSVSTLFNESISLTHNRKGFVQNASETSPPSNCRVV